MTSQARRRDRNRWFLVGALPAALLLLISLRAGLVMVEQTQGRQAYARGDYAAAAGHFADNATLNPVAPWLAPFNEGAARFREGRYAAAANAFDAALPDAPTEWTCAVRGNLALSHEAAGDEAERAGDGEAARAAWQAGRDAVAPCTTMPSGDVPDAELQQRKAARSIDVRLADKLGEVRIPPDPVAEHVPPVREQQAAELEHLNEQARENRQNAEQRRREREQDQNQDPGPDIRW